jgi:hypothetical protein
MASSVSRISAAGWLKVNLPLSFNIGGAGALHYVAGKAPAENALDLDR